MSSLNRLRMLGLVVAGVMLAGGLHAEGDKANGRKLIYTCNGCHGVPGWSNVYPSYPVPEIVGQNQQYIVDALEAYKHGQRIHPTMQAQAQSLSDQEIADVAAYLSSLSK